MKREFCRTQSLAAGNESFFEEVKPLMMFQPETEIVEESIDFENEKENEDDLLGCGCAAL